MTQRGEETLLVVVEPAGPGACVQSAVASGGRIETLEGAAESAYQGCNCERASLTAWRVLRDREFLSIAVEDPWAREATAMFQDAGIRSSPTGSAGLAGLMAWLALPDCPLEPESNVLILNTEDGRLQQSEACA